MANTAANYVVVVKKGQEPTRDNEVFSGDWGYTNEASLLWKSDKLLQIILPDDALVFWQKEKLGDVAITIEFASNDPRARESALRTRERLRK